MTGQTAVTLEKPTGDVIVHVVKDHPIPSPGEGEVSAQLAVRGICRVLLFSAGSKPSFSVMVTWRSTGLLQSKAGMLAAL